MNIHMLRKRVKHTNTSFIELRPNHESILSRSGRAVAQRCELVSGLDTADRGEKLTRNSTWTMHHGQAFIVLFTATASAP
jgi:hypothetical protein